MGLRARMIAAITELGPMKRAVLEGMAKTQHEVKVFDRVLDSMLRTGSLVRCGRTKGVVFDVPGRRR
jgi:hypothetical protein